MLLVTAGMRDFLISAGCNVQCVAQIGLRHRQWVDRELGCVAVPNAIIC